MNESDAALEVRGLVKRYSMGEEEVRAVDGVSLRVGRGDFAAVMGPSGSGKTTLLNLLGCIDRPTSGEVFVGGREVSALNDRDMDLVRLRRIGFVFQRINLIPILNAAENIELPMEIAGVPAEERIARAVELLDAVGLRGRARHRPSQMSAGEQQRVGIARALANRPDVLLADEPTGNLDSRTTKDIIALLKRINEENGHTLVLVTHNPEVADAARRCIHMRDGKIVS